MRAGHVTTRRRALVALAAGCVLLAGCSTPDDPDAGTSATSAGETASEAGTLAEASVDAVDAVGRGAAISAQRNGDAWDVIVSSHAGQTWQVTGLPDDDATAAEVEVSDEVAEVNGRVRTVLDTAPLLDERAEEIVSSADGEPVDSVVLEERGDETVWAVTTVDGTTSDVTATS
ncbi:hypothetical protein [Paraoerskovia marina]|uniref:hypothetical protein n=1 Tax=Paraoerskovia marina TaxID=545619 RepID=UPI00049255BF|nr:hypothetical protein [Paraoerskovia marina]